MKIDRLVLGSLLNNCYILSLEDECIVIDPSCDYEKIKEKINNKILKGVLVTHNHFDHIGALNNFPSNLIYDKNNLDEKEIKLGKFKFEVIYTPGHKEDSITFYFKKEKVMFTGDFIFKDTIGRIDLPGGSIFDMIKSLEKMKEYDDDIKIYPGHGEYTYLGYEKKQFSNYY